MYKIKKILNYVIVIVTTITIVLTAILGYTFFQERNMVEQDHANLTTVINFINAQIQAQQK